ncbi:protein kinase [Lipingzhangella sp. LS1_29]|uniref:Protein kinase n=1 Tax=Lipingzhangella rawalii TaxID=2055835 RepID=A0ABU2H8Y2_9ACTN|nr:protein kinase [Lipingzhangella rawalii]MDS1271305.1 protein kinase [Lipingzhangella rawalii]
MEQLRDSDPTQLGNYRLLGRLGAGGMGQVYLGQSPGNRMVAVKTIHRQYAADPDFRTRFAREVSAARKVSGAFTAPVLDADADADLPWLATAYIPAPTLEAAVSENEPLPETTTRVLGAGLAEALLDIHRQGLTHRDLKPANVLLSEDGPRVLDFGIARSADATSLTMTNQAIGTIGYMSPEQLEGREVGPASDMFSLGAVLAFASGGRTAFPTGGSLASVVRQVCDGEPDLTGVPEPLQETVAACLQKDPRQRPTPSDLLGLTQGLPVQQAWLPRRVTQMLQQRTTPLQSPGETLTYTEAAPEPGPRSEPPAGAGSTMRQPSAPEVERSPQSRPPASDARDPGTAPPSPASPPPLGSGPSHLAPPSASPQPPAPPTPSQPPAPPPASPPVSPQPAQRPRPHNQAGAAPPSNAPASASAGPPPDPDLQRLERELNSHNLHPPQVPTPAPEAQPSNDVGFFGTMFGIIIMGAVPVVQLPVGWICSAGWAWLTQSTSWLSNWYYPGFFTLDGFGHALLLGYFLVNVILGGMTFLGSLLSVGSNKADDWGAAVGAAIIAVGTLVILMSLGFF